MLIPTLSRRRCTNKLRASWHGDRWTLRKERGAARHACCLYVGLVGSAFFALR